MASSSSNHEREVDQELWQACAGVDIDVPKLDSLVYYFPKDHFEHSYSSLDECGCGSFLCRVTNVSFHADSETDQVFVKFLLQPCNTDDPSKNPDPNPNPIQNRIHNNATVTFVKVLTKTDMQEGLIVLKALGDNIFSKLPQNPPEIIRWIDVHGKIWEIMLQLKNGKLRKCCRNYAGGWSDFRDIKNLTPEDSIVFLLKKSTNECHVGIRRADINRPISAKDVKDAIKKAQELKSFEVVYYPIVGLPEFIVPKVKVDNARCIDWRPEMPVKFPCEIGGLEPIKSWHYGRILNIEPLKLWHNWPDSWWRVLQVEWYNREILEKKPNLQKSMSPWELHVSALPTTHFFQ